MQGKITLLLFFMRIESEILKEIEVFCQISGVSERKLGLDVAKTHKLVKRIRDGFELRSGTINAIRDYIKNYKSE